MIDTVSGRVSVELLKAMRDSMMARGPDGDGQYIDGPIGMAMRRLSIIDLKTGSQPFFSRDQSVVAFQNGEIYNYRELRTELKGAGYQFISQSDTEVLAHGFVEFGPERLFQRLDGMFGAAILERRTRQLHLARDRFGENPLFYTGSKGRFAYSSSMLALAALDWVSDEIDAISLNRYLALHYVPGESTIFKAIKRVLPGERLVIPLDNPVPIRHRFYTLLLGEERSVAASELACLLETAIESRLVADVPVGVFLSGGLDSSILAAVAARKHPGIATFSMGFASADHDESHYAQLVANRIGSDHHHFRFEEESFRELLPEVAASLDEPVGDQAQLPLFWLCREARRYVKVALSGEGADEVFGGYSYYPAAEARTSRIKRFIRGSRINNSAARLIDNADPVTPSGFPLLTDAATRKRLTGNSQPKDDEWENALLAFLMESCGAVQRAAATDMATWLVDDLLVKFDRMSMAHSLEGRAPYLAPTLVEAGISLPAIEKISDGVSKIALRRIATRWLPPEIVERPKQGFVLPMASWLRRWFATSGTCDSYFHAREVPGLDMSEVTKLTAEDLSHGVLRERLLFALVLLVEWHHSFNERRARWASIYRAAN